MHIQKYIKLFWANYGRITLAVLFAGLGVGSFITSSSSAYRAYILARWTAQREVTAVLPRTASERVVSRAIERLNKSAKPMQTYASSSSRSVDPKRLTLRITDVVPVAPAPLKPAAPAEPDAQGQASASSVSRTVLPALLKKEEAFPAFDHAVFPVLRVPNWGAMHTAREWNRTYYEMKESDYVPVPSYNMAVLTTPMANLTDPFREEYISAITSKLTYSTRFFGAYDLDSGEFTAIHAGVDIKLAQGTPVGAIGGGRVSSIRSTQTLGLHVIIEHRLNNGETYYSIYGHLDTAAVKRGESVVPGQMIGRVGMTGNTSGPHVHLQIDRGQPNEDHVPYFPSVMPSRAEADKWTVHPITFIATHAQ